MAPGWFYPGNRSRPPLKERLDISREEAGRGSPQCRQASWSGSLSSLEAAGPSRRVGRAVCCPVQVAPSAWVLVERWGAMPIAYFATPR